MANTIEGDARRPHDLNRSAKPRFDPQTLRALAAFLPRFEAPGFVFGGWTDPPALIGGFELSPVAEGFVSACYEAGWVQWPDFDWGTWKNSAEARQLYFDPAALETATPEQLSRLLTVLIRQERFVDGALNAAFESGVLLRILRRIAVLSAKTPA